MVLDLASAAMRLALILRGQAGELATRSVDILFKNASLLRASMSNTRRHKEDTGSSSLLRRISSR